VGPSNKGTWTAAHILPLDKTALVGVRFPVGITDFIFTTAFRPVLRPIKPLIHVMYLIYTESFFRGRKKPELEDNHSLVLKLM
jgi:hypothetical protein